MGAKRYSRQREMIFQALCNTTEHPTAEMVYNWLKPKNPSLSLGTVYRNLNLLADSGMIMRLAFPIERYDANTKPHPHFQCLRCGRVYDLDGLSYDPHLDEAASQYSGHQISRHEIVFYGICIHCTGD
ncbi:MAG: transcriptional repressor [Intestinimonas sp.]|jgi:Fur family peroxide stress response transcriptional regulator|nr:transcriptional repressor [Intestinimonas sp.]